MLRAPVDISRSRAHQIWNGPELAARTDWRRAIPAAVLAEFAAFCAARGATPEVDAFEFDGAAWPQLTALAAELRHDLLHGHGLSCLTGLAHLDAPQQRLFYLALGCALGTPMTEYGRLYEVADRGGSYKTQAIPVSQTGAETGFHTDSSRLDCVPDVVALLCERPSETGGESLVSNALHAHRWLAEHEPWALETLHRPLVRDLVTPGVERTPEALLANRFPVFAPCDRPEGLLFRYMRYWIERGQTTAGAPLGDRELAALDALDRALARGAVGFRLERGDMLFVNNRTIAHNRSAYQDAPGKVRRLWRMWLRLD